MLVFIDESGDPGFKIARGSSTHFVVTLVIFDRVEAAGEAERVIEDLARTLAVKPEFKFNKMKPAARDAFFHGIAPLDFRTRSLVLDKRIIYSQHLKSKTETFYNFVLRHVMQSAARTWVHAKVVIDGSGDRAFRMALTAYLRRHIDAQAVRKVVLRNSEGDRLLQLADMCAGAIARSYSTDRTEPDRWRRALRRCGKIDDVWDFR